MADVPGVKAGDSLRVVLALAGLLVPLSLALAADVLGGSRHRAFHAVTVSRSGGEECKFTLPRREYLDSVCGQGKEIKDWPRSEVLCKAAIGLLRGACAEGDDVCDECRWVKE